MAEEQIEYQIEFDEQDLSHQLNRIKSQIDAALSQEVFSPSEIPQASAVTGAAGVGASAPQPSMAPVLPANFGQMQDQSFWEQTSQYLDRAAERTSVGFSRFTEDLRRTGFIDQERYPEFRGAPSGFGRGYPSGFLESTVGMISPGLAGFDPRQGIARGEFKQAAAENIATSFSEFASNNIGTLAGVLGGAVFGAMTGGVGILGAAATGFATAGNVDLANMILGGTINQRHDIAGGIQEMAAQNFGNITFGRSLDIAEQIQGEANSFIGRATGVTTQELQENILQFERAGGFENVQDPDEFERVIQGVIDNARDFANNLNMAQDEAINIMAQLENKLITSSERADQFSNRLSQTSGDIGMSPRETLQLGMQGSQMVRGTGISPNAGFNMMLESQRQVERMRRTDPRSRQLIADFGGPRRAAQANMESAMRWMQSGQGMFHVGSMLGGNRGIPGSTSGLLTNFAEYIGEDPGNMFRLVANQSEVLEDMSIQEMRTRQVATAEQMYRNLRGLPDDEQIGSQELIGFMSQIMNMSPRNAALALQTVRHGENPLQRRRENLLGQYRSQLENQGYGPLGAISGAFGEATDFAYRALQGPVVGRAFQSLEDNIYQGTRQVLAGLSGNQLFFNEGLQSETARQAFKEFSNTSAREAAASITGQRPEDFTEDEARRIVRYRSMQDFRNNLQESGAITPQHGRLQRRLENEGISFQEQFMELQHGMTTPEKMNLMEQLYEFDDQGYTEQDIQNVITSQRIQNEKLNTNQKQQVTQIKGRIYEEDANIPDSLINQLQNNNNRGSNLNSLSRHFFASPFGNLSQVQKRALIDYANESGTRLARNVTETSLNIPTSASRQAENSSQRAQQRIEELTSEINTTLDENISDIESPFTFAAEQGYVEDFSRQLREKITSGEITSHAELEAWADEGPPARKDIASQFFDNIGPGGFENVVSLIQEREGIRKVIEAQPQIQAMTKAIRQSNLPEDTKTALANAARHDVRGSVIAGEEVRAMFEDLSRSGRESLISSFQQQFSDASDLQTKMDVFKYQTSLKQSIDMTNAEKLLEKGEDDTLQEVTETLDKRLKDDSSAKLFELFQFMMSNANGEAALNVNVVQDDG